MNNLKRSTIALSIFIALLCSGCDGGAKAALQSFERQCKGVISAEVTVSQWNNSFTAKCDNFKMEWK